MDVDNTKNPPRSTAVEFTETLPHCDTPDTPGLRTPSGHPDTQPDTQVDTPRTLFYSSRGTERALSSRAPTFGILAS